MSGRGDARVVPDARVGAHVNSTIPATTSSSRALPSAQRAARTKRKSKEGSTLRRQLPTATADGGRRSYSDPMARPSDDVLQLEEWLLGPRVRPIPSDGRRAGTRSLTLACWPSRPTAFFVVGPINASSIVRLVHHQVLSGAEAVALPRPALSGTTPPTAAFNSCGKGFSSGWRVGGTLPPLARC